MDELRARMLAKKVEEHGFNCVAGPLENSEAWQALRRELGMDGGQHFYQVEDGWLETHTGHRFPFAEPEPRDVRLWDVAHALSMSCRYNGHTLRFYSVAEHACIIADWLWANGHGAQVSLTGLHHDDAEAYIGDMARPVKVTLPDFKKLEDRIDAAVAARFGTLHPLPAIVKECDTRVLQDERRQAMSNSDNDWGTDGLLPLGVEIEFWPPGRACQEFLERHVRLTDLMET